MKRPAVGRLRPGTVLDARFEIVEFLGAGSFGEVYRAHQLVFGARLREVAVKLFHTGRVGPDTAVEKLADAIALIRLQSERPPPEVLRRLVQVYDLGAIATPAPRVYMSLELIAGGRTLADLVRRHPSGMPVALALEMFERLLVPLAWIHEQGMVHGDLKPDNVLLGDDDDVVLTDFGLAAAVEVGVAGGAIPYEAPEVLNGVGGETQADVYSLAVLLCELLTGTTPFVRVGLDHLAVDDQRGYLRAHIDARRAFDRNELRSLVGRNPELDEHPQLEALLARCLTYRVGERISHAGQLRATLRDYRCGAMAGWVTEAPAGEHVADPLTSTLGDAAALIATDPRRALARLDGLPETANARVEVLLLRARALSACGVSAQASAVLNRARQAAPRDPRVLEALADYFADSGKLTMAAQMRARAARLRRSGGGR